MPELTTEVSFNQTIPYFAYLLGSMFLKIGWKKSVCLLQPFAHKRLHGKWQILRE